MYSYCSCRLQAKDYIGKWVVLFFYPKDFTFVCPTEIIAFSDAAEAFAKKNCAVIGASTDSAEVHLAWINTPRKKGGLGQMKIPLLADVSRRISKAYGVLGAGNFPYRGIFLMDPQVSIWVMHLCHAFVSTRATIHLSLNLVVAVASSM